MYSGTGLKAAVEACIALQGDDVASLHVLPRIRARCSIDRRLGGLLDRGRPGLPVV